ncbi:MAG: hypothetical protein ACTSV7_07010 [Candidatus Baldrarchaeia archaeon]
MNLLFIVKFILAVIFVEAVTEILAKSELFKPVRKFFFDRKSNRVFEKIHELMDCGYCTSVWIGFLTALLMFGDLDLISKYVDWFFIGIILHRLSNLLHSILDYIDRDRYKDIDSFINGQGA